MRKMIVCLMMVLISVLCYLTRTYAGEGETSLTGLLGITPEKKSVVNSGFIDFNYYYDNRDFHILTMNLGAQLPDNFEYFQLLNMYSPLGSGYSERWDLSNFYTEMNLRRQICKGNEWLKSLDWTVQYVDGSTAKDLVRLGTRLRYHSLPGPIGDFFRDFLELKYSMDFHLYESDGEGWQIEHVYRKDIFNNLIYFSGFIDQNIDKTGVYLVSEHQVGLKIIDNFYYVTELRYTTRNPPGDKWGVGFGVEYLVKF